MITIHRFKDFQGPFKFQNFQGPIPFSRTFQVLETGAFVFKDFQGLSRPCGHPVSIIVWIICC